MVERKSYKLFVGGSSPSPATKLYRGVTHPWQNVDCHSGERGVRKRRGLTPRPQNSIGDVAQAGESVCLVNRSVRVQVSPSPPKLPGPRPRHQSSKLNLRKKRRVEKRHRGSIPPWASNFFRLCSSSGKSKRLISVRLEVQLLPQPPKLSFASRAGSLTD